MAIRVLIVEDEPEFIRRFSEAVANDPSLELVAATGTGREARALIDRHRPDVVLVDLGLPDIPGVEVIAHAARQQPECDVLVVTMFADDEHVVRSIEAGASGYLLKDASAERIAAGIHEMRSGGAPISPGIARRVLARFRANASAATPSQPAPLEVSPLTARESELLRMISKGFTFDKIGALMNISPHTVVAHVKKIYRKLAVHSRSEAVYEASQLGLL